MAKDKINLREKTTSYKLDLDILQKIPCTKEENKQYQELLKNGGVLPENVYSYGYNSNYNEFYKIHESDLTEDEISEYLTYKRLSLLNTIKNCVVFFTVLSVIGIIAYILMFLSTQ